MAKVTRVTFTDDLDGSEAAGTVTFAIDGQSYEIDLSDANDAKFRELMEPYRAVARKVASAEAPKAKGRGKGKARPGGFIPIWLAPLDGKSIGLLTADELALIAPRALDDEETAKHRLKAWCRASGYQIRGRGGASQHAPAYKLFFAGRALPAKSEVRTGMARELVSAASGRAHMPKAEEPALPESSPKVAKRQAPAPGKKSPPPVVFDAGHQDEPDQPSVKPKRAPRKRAPKVTAPSE